MQPDDPTPALPIGTLLGIDYGSVRVGLALCDRGQTIAAPFQLLQRQSSSEEAVLYQNLVKQERIVGIVLGLPVHMSGTESAKSKEVRRYGTWLSKITGLPVVYHDERYSSTLAWNALQAGGLKASQRKKQLDKVAAQMILQSFLDSLRNPDVRSGVESLDNEPTTSTSE
jgi:putative Holliday junction resolvase